MNLPRTAPKPTTRRVQSLVVVTLLVLLVLRVVWRLPAFALKEHAVFSRPDGQYRVVVLRRSTPWSMMPGQASDAAGVVRLYDRAGKLLQEAPVEMVQMADGVHWTDRHVRIHLVADWDLPD